MRGVGITPVTAEDVWEGSFRFRYLHRDIPANPEIGVPPILHGTVGNCNRDPCGS